MDVQTDINIPTAYILPNILIGFAIGNYPFKDINGYGGMVLREPVRSWYGGFPNVYGQCLLHVSVMES